MSKAASPGGVFAALASAATPGRRVEGRGGGRYLLEFSAPWGLQLLTSNISQREPLSLLSKVFLLLVSLSWAESQHMFLSVTVT